MADLDDHQAFQAAAFPLGVDDRHIADGLRRHHDGVQGGILGGLSLGRADHVHDVGLTLRLGVFDDLGTPLLHRGHLDLVPGGVLVRHEADGHFVPYLESLVEQGPVPLMQDAERSTDRNLHFNPVRTIAIIRTTKLTT